jgi:hypothetical protein
MRARFPSAMLASLLLVSLAGPTDGSTIEEATSHFVSYQFDGASHHDAPDGCSEAHGEWSTTIGATTDGMLVAPDDVSDVFVLDVPAAQRGQRLVVALTEPSEVATLQLAVLAPGCAGSVLDLVNWPTPQPSPPAPAPGESQHASNVDPWHCDSRQWLFAIDQLQDHSEPASIHVAWTDGTEHPVPLSGRYGSLAVYSTQENLGILLKGAWANLASEWDGRFGLAVGPCDAVDGGAVYGDAPTVDMGVLAFTPVHAGPHVVQIRYAGPFGAVSPVPAPVSVDLGPLMPATGDDLPDEPTGTLQGFGHVHDHSADDHATADHTHGPGGVVIPKLPDANSLRATAPDPSTATALPATMVPDPSFLTQPIVVPASCHGCVDGVDGLWETVSYRLSARAA